MNTVAKAHAREPPARKSPTPFTPSWTWMVLVALSNVFRKSFWKRVLTPEHQATWHVASAIQTVQILGAVSIYKWFEINAPWVLQFGIAVANGVKAILVKIWMFILAVLAVAFE